MSFIEFAFKGVVAPSRRELEQAQRLAYAEQRLARYEPQDVDDPDTGLTTGLTQGAYGWRSDPKVNLEEIKARAQSAVVTLVSWAMVCVLAVSLIGIIALSILGRKSPEILTICVSSPLGYFGGLLSAYFGVQR
jgi:hypothetical protein